jgi:hypothetical protein
VISMKKPVYGIVVETGQEIRSVETGGPRLPMNEHDQFEHLNLPSSRKTGWTKKGLEGIFVRSRYID